MKHNYKETSNKRMSFLLRILSACMILLGFSSCSKENDMLCEYGSPIVKFLVHGTIKDDKDAPAQGVQVILSNYGEYLVNNKEVSALADTVYTDANGAFTCDPLTTPGIKQAKIYLKDVDGEANGGTFQTDSIEFIDMHAQQTVKGDGGWNEGTYESTISRSLKKVKK